MEILMLVLLYYLSQNADFAKSVQPIMSKLKDSEQMLHFLNELSKFTQTFSTFQSPPCEEKEKEPAPPKCEQEKKQGDKEKTPQSPTAGIADEFIQQILDSYLKKS